MNLLVKCEINVASFLKTYLKCNRKRTMKNLQQHKYEIGYIKYLTNILTVAWQTFFFSVFRPSPSMANTAPFEGCFFS